MLHSHYSSTATEIQALAVFSKIFEFFYLGQATCLFPWERKERARTAEECRARSSVQVGISTVWGTQAGQAGLLHVRTRIAFTPRCTKHRRQAQLLHSNLGTDLSHLRGDLLSLFFRDGIFDGFGGAVHNLFGLFQT